MSTFLKIILIGSILFNILAIWGFFYYIMYGGNPLLELKRKLTGTSRQTRAVDPRAEENARIMTEIAEGRADSLRVVFFGASITNSWDLNKYFPEFHPINRGVGGFAAELLSKYKANVLDLKPKAAVIKLCSINMRPSIPAQQLKDVTVMMVELAEVNGIIPVVATMVPAAKPAATIGEFDVMAAINDYNSFVRDLTSRKGLPMIDYAAAIGNEEGFLPHDCSIDPVHVNDKGYDIMAEAARPVLHRVLGIE